MGHRPRSAVITEQAVTLALRPGGGYSRLDLRVSSPTSGPPADGWGGKGTGTEGWLPAAWRAAAVLIAAVVGFMVVPDRVVAYLSLHVAPRTRDAVVLLWSVFWFVALSFAFVLLQRKRST